MLGRQGQDVCGMQVTEGSIAPFNAVESASLGFLACNTYHYPSPSCLVVTRLSMLFSISSLPLLHHKQYNQACIFLPPRCFLVNATSFQLFPSFPLSLLSSSPLAPSPPCSSRPLPYHVLFLLGAILHLDGGSMTKPEQCQARAETTHTTTQSFFPCGCYKHHKEVCALWGTASPTRGNHDLQQLSNSGLPSRHAAVDPQ